MVIILCEITREVTNSVIDLNAATKINAFL